jgi:hypothetical protein
MRTKKSLSRKRGNELIIKSITDSTFQRTLATSTANFVWGEQRCLRASTFAVRESREEMVSTSKNFHTLITHPPGFC